MTDSWARWCTKFDRTMEAAYQAHYYRWMWRTINAVIDQSGVKKQPTLVNYLNTTYVAYIGSFVRREVDTRRDVVSLTGCVRDLEADLSLITRSRYAELNVQAHGDQGPDDASGFHTFAPHGGENLERKVLAGRRIRLAAAASGVKSFVDENIAHTSHKPSGTVVTYRDVDSAMQEIEAIEKELYFLRHPGVALWTVTPVPDLAFLEMFQTAWFPPGSTLPPSAS
ncbi:hypothetical protein [uncultured Amnibacterium sp.]|uniref:hypothetical protein n=1 Tax=uncultured Amnibacterium sp. TaxID=1631851 RepID=UPI0035CA6740